MELQDRRASFYRFEPRVTAPWFDFKRKLNDSIGLKVSINYTAMLLGASSKISEDNQQNAGGGIFDLTLNWNFINRKKGKNQGSLILWLDQRHLYWGEVAPQNLNFETGSATLPAVKFGEWSFRALELYYQQKLWDRVAVVIGKIDMPDWFVYHGLMHPMMHFTDMGFNVNPTVSYSNPGLGIVVGGWLDKQKRFGIVAGLNDVAGDNIFENNFLDFGTSGWKQGKFLKMLEFEFTPGAEKYYFNRISATFWHSDELLESDNSWYTTPSSKGFSVQATWLIQERYIPVVTFALTDGNGANSVSQLNISVMHAWLFPSRDMLGVGVNYSESTVNGNGQFLSEVFYRFTLSKALVLTPVLKFVVNPSLDPNQDFLMYYGLRTRVSF